MKASPKSVVVAGAGAFGVSSARELARRGHRVTLVDPGPVPHPLAASTDVSKMVRMDYGTDEFYMALAERAIERWEEWDRRSGRGLLHLDGFLLLSRAELSGGGFEGDSFRMLRSRGYRPERLKAEEIARLFPVWRRGAYADGYLSPRAGWAESGSAVDAVFQEAVAAGVRLRRGRVEAVLHTGSRVAGVTTEDGQRIRADVVVVACGAWTPFVLPWLGELMWPAAQPVFHFAVEEPERYQPPRFPPWAADLSNSGWYGFPALSDGTLKIANHGPGMRLHPDDGRGVPPDAEDGARAFLRESMPELVDAPLRSSRLCLYCDTFDSDFWIDEDPSREGLFVAAGGSGHGFKFLPLIGHVVADLVEGRANPWTHRFRWRTLGERRTEAARFSG